MPTAYDQMFFLDPYTVARDRGLRVVRPGPKDIQLDIDTPEQLAHYTAQLELLNHLTQDQFSEVKRTVSPGGNTHVYVRSHRPLQPTTRIAFQTLLGSDPKRELLSMARLMVMGDDLCTVLFERDTSAKGTR